MTPDSRDLQPLADEATSLLKALAHPARLMICCQLRDCEMSVGEIEETLGVRQPRLSRELGKLREEGLVETRRESKIVFYRLSQKGRVQAMVDAICGVMLGKDAMASTIAKSLGTPKPKPNRAGGYGVFARTGTNT
jgi:DNA-binding transcriptional ArsR family regulator